jgi:hypothetical protein
MRSVLTIAVSALALAGCAEGYDRSADGNACNRLAPADRQAQWNLVTPGVASLGIDMPGKRKPGGNAPNTAKCVHPDGNKTNAPQIHDLQKIG